MDYFKENFQVYDFSPYAEVKSKLHKLLNYVEETQRGRDTHREQLQQEAASEIWNLTNFHLKLMKSNADKIIDNDWIRNGVAVRFLQQTVIVLSNFYEHRYLGYVLKHNFVQELLFVLYLLNFVCISLT